MGGRLEVRVLTEGRFFREPAVVEHHWHHRKAAAAGHVEESVEVIEEVGAHAAPADQALDAIAGEGGADP
jgi:hypothetical protein